MGDDRQGKWKEHTILVINPGKIPIIKSNLNRDFNEKRGTPCKYLGDRAIQAGELQRLLDDNMHSVFKEYPDERLLTATLSAVTVC